MDVSSRERTTNGAGGVESRPRLATAIRVGLFAGLGFLVLTGIVVPALHHALTSRPLPPLERIARLPDFAFSERGGGTLSLGDLRGKVWVADFIFTRCPDFCMRMSRQMRRVQDALPSPAREQVRLVSFTVDPEWDTVERLAEYARGYGADPDVWHLVTGEKQDLLGLMQSGFLLPGLTGGDTPAGPNHSTRFVLVDPDGFVRGFYEGVDRETVQPLLRDIGRLLRELDDR